MGSYRMMSSAFDSDKGFELRIFSNFSAIHYIDAGLYIPIESNLVISRRCSAFTAVS